MAETIENRNRTPRTLEMAKTVENKLYSRPAKLETVKDLGEKQQNTSSHSVLRRRSNILQRTESLKQDDRTNLGPDEWNNMSPDEWNDVQENPNGEYNYLRDYLQLEGTQTEVTDDLQEKPNDEYDYLQLEGTQIEEADELQETMYGKFDYLESHRTQQDKIKTDG
jgi:hypothetical protein